MSALSALLAEARRLDAAATKGPWEQHDGGHDFPTVCRYNGDNTCAPLFEACGHNPHADSEFAAFARLALPALAAVAEAAVAWREAEAASDRVPPTCTDTDLFQRLIDRRRSARAAFDAAVAAAGGGE